MLPSFCFRCAGEEIYYYLELTRQKYEPYGSAFAGTGLRGGDHGRNCTAIPVMRRNEVGSTRPKTGPVCVVEYTALEHNSIHLQASLLNSVLAGSLGLDVKSLYTCNFRQFIAILAISRSQLPVIYHYGSFDLFAFLFMFRKRTTFVYHNYTPARFFWRWEPLVAIRSLFTRMQLLLMPRRTAWIAVSPWNAQCLKELDFSDVRECPCIVRGSEAGEQGAEPALLFVGRISPNKNCLELVGQVRKAAHLLQTKITLSIVGDVKPGCPYGKRFTSYISEISSVDPLRIRWYRGRVSQCELDELYWRSWLYVSMSLHEGFGLPVCEAIAHGVPAVYLECGGTESVLSGLGMVPLQERERFWSFLVNFIESKQAREELLGRQKQVVNSCMLPKVEETIRSVYGSFYLLASGTLA